MMSQVCEGKDNMTTDETDDHKLVQSYIKTNKHQNPKYIRERRRKRLPFIRMEIIIHISGIVTRSDLTRV